VIKKHRVTLSHAGYSPCVLDIITTETARGFTAHAAYLGLSTAYDTRQAAIEQLCKAHGCTLLETSEE